jgi:hypothetical protein
MPSMAEQEKAYRSYIDYQTYKVRVNGKPSGMVIKAENKSNAQRVLAIASERLGFGTTGVSLK